METARYRIADPKGAYMPRSPELKVLALGTEYQDAMVMAIRAPVFEMLAEGTEIEYAGVPGPHLAPLNEAAREAMAAYQAKGHGSMDPTRHFPGGQDPMGGLSLQQNVEKLLDGMERDASLRALARPAEAPAGNADMAALIGELRALVAALAQPPAKQGRAA
jgi:hypothetical protein